MSTTNSYLLKPLSLHKYSSPRMSSNLPTRRQLLFSTASLAALTLSLQHPSRAEDIPLFGIRKNLKKAEKEAEVIVKEGFEGAEKGIEAVEREVESVEREVEDAVSFGGLAQAGAVAGAEFVGVLVATSVVNGILGQESS